MNRRRDGEIQRRLEEESRRGRRKAREWKRGCGGGNHRGRKLKEIEDVEKKKKRKELIERNSLLLSSSDFSVGKIDCLMICVEGFFKGFMVF